MEEQGINTILSAILNIGNITFRKVKSGLPAQVDPESRKYLQRAAKLLDTSESDLEGLLTVEKNARSTRRASIHVASAALSTETRNRLAMSLYSRLFHWIVDKINLRDRGALDVESDHVRIFQLIDVPGFEKHAKNSLEQLFINVVDEVLQREFYSRMCNSRSALLEDEEVEVESLVVHDADLLLNVLGLRLSVEDKPATSSNGVFQLLDEQTKVEGNNRTFLAKVIQAHSGVIVDYEEAASDGTINKGRVELIQKTGQNKNMFKVMHFMGPVSYSTTGLVRRNIDAESVASIETFIVSKCKATMLTFLFDFGRATVGGGIDQVSSQTESPRSARGRRSTRIGRSSTLMPNISALGPAIMTPVMAGVTATPGTKEARARTRCQFFVDEMQQLAAGLHETHVHFVKCIRPNSVHSPTIFAGGGVLRQLINGGIFAAGEAYRSQFSVVQNFRDFYREYKHLAVTKHPSWQSMTKEALKHLCSELLKDICTVRTSDPALQNSFASIKIGKDSCLMQEAQLEQLNNLSYSTSMGSIVTIQKMARGYIYSMQYPRLRALANSARRAIASRDLARLKGILHDLVAERPKIYDGVADAQRSRIRADSSRSRHDESASKLRAYSASDDAVLAHVPDEYDFRCNVFQRLQTLIWSLESELEFHPFINKIRKNGLGGESSRRELEKAQSIVAKLTRAYELNPSLQLESPHMDEFMKLVTKWQEFIRIEDILTELQSRSIAHMPLVLAVGAVRSLYIIVRQCERSFQELGVRSELSRARRRIKYFQQRLHQEYHLVSNIMPFIEDIGCVSGGVYQLEVSKTDVYKLEAALDRLCDFQQALRVSDNSADTSDSVESDNQAEVRIRSTGQNGSSSQIEVALDDIAKGQKVAPLTLTSARALFLGRKLAALRRAVIEFQHNQKVAVTNQMRERMETILEQIRDTTGSGVTLDEVQQVEVEASMRKYEQTVFQKSEDQHHFRQMRGFDMVWARWIAQDSKEVALVRRELDLHMDVDEFVWTLQQETTAILTFGSTTTTNVSYFNVEECLDIPDVTTLKQSYDALVSKNVHQYIDLNRQRMVESAQFLIYKIQPLWVRLRALLNSKPYHTIQLRSVLLQLDSMFTQLWAQNGRLAVECASGNRHHHEELPIWKISLMIIESTKVLAL